MMTRAGQTEPGNTAWKQTAGRTNSIYVDVDTSAAGFANDPTRPVIYTTSIGGANQQWATVGATALYKVTHKGFRVFIRWADFSALTPDYANEVEWHINWIGWQAP